MIGCTMLALLGEEAKRNVWEREGLRLVGRTQRCIKAFKAARESWEFIRKDLPDDVEANLQLATIYQRLGDSVTASQACRHVLDNPAAKRSDRADARSQLARNDKASWFADFRSLDTPEARRRQAVSDHRLVEAFDGYMAGLAEDLNDYYSGINALGLLTVIVNLADMEPNAWAGCFRTTREATNKLDDYREQLIQLRGAVGMSLENARRRGEMPDLWVLPTQAQCSLLTTEKDRAVFVGTAYKAAKKAGGARFEVQSEAEQVVIFHSLGLFPENCRAALEALGVTAPVNKAADQPKPPRDRVIVATGHRADALNRPPPGRFPNTAACIAKAKAWLREVIAAEKAATAGSFTGIAGAASGTDLLFHEVCAELGIPTTVVLPISVDDYRRQSVADGGTDWIDKFNTLVVAKENEKRLIVLSNDADVPSWAAGIPNYGVFQRGNIWMLEDALIRPNADATLVALWNGKAGDGPGGTADMVALAQAHGAKVRKQNTDELFGLGQQS